MRGKRLVQVIPVARKIKRSSNSILFSKLQTLANSSRNHYLAEMPDRPTDCYDWRPLTTEIPSEQDFDPSGEGLDEQHAWKEFGGLALDQAYEHFLDCPENRQEDFMFMGPRAFLFYFPVVERYLYSAHNSDDWGDRATWILGHVFINQITNPELWWNEALHLRVGGLVRHVRAHLDQYSVAAEDQARIDGPWAKLGEILATANG